MADDEQGKPAAIGTIARVGDQLVVHLPPSIEMPEGEVTVQKDGDRLIIEWPRKTLVDLLKGMEPLTDEDGFPNVDEGLLPLRDVDILAIMHWHCPSQQRGSPSHVSHHRCRRTWLTPLQGNLWLFFLQP